jgi:hypothetical protein
MATWASIHRNFLAILRDSSHGFHRQHKSSHKVVDSLLQCLLLSLHLPSRADHLLSSIHSDSTIFNSSSKEVREEGVQVFTDMDIR